MIREFTGMADDGFGSMVLVPDELLPDVLVSSVNSVKHCDAFSRQGPYSVTHFANSGWYAVQNFRGENCLRFSDRPGAVFSNVAAVAVLAARKFDADGVLR